MSSLLLSSFLPNPKSFTPMIPPLFHFPLGSPPTYLMFLLMARTTIAAFEISQIITQPFDDIKNCVSIIQKLDHNELSHKFKNVAQSILNTICEQSMPRSSHCWPYKNLAQCPKIPLNLNVLNCQSIIFEQKSLVMLMMVLWGSDLIDADAVQTNTSLWTCELWIWQFGPT